jgi:cellulose synthase/poly-beta-1,6-N-acetylglucosamine synthase-like glycosyltransferase
MLSFVHGFNLFIFVALTIMYCYQMIYVLVGLFGDRKKNDRSALAVRKQHKFAVVIAARNERAVIGELIRSIKNQNYPAELLDTIVVADNCTDDTAQVARDAGAIVYERFNKEQVGKGYALDYLFKHIYADYPDAGYEGYFVFDADNLLDENYVAEMNKIFDGGYRIITSYRNSKNYGSNWISAGYALWFLREARFLNNSRMQLNSSCAVSGTGFLISDEIVRENNGWKHHLLTEDIEFSIDSVIHGEKIGYCEKAKIYDEQPVTFKQSWTQRMRWSKGFYQVLGKYGMDLIKAMFNKDRSFLSCYDMFMTICPAMFVTLFAIVINGGILIASVMDPAASQMLIDTAARSVAFAFINFYLILYVMGILTTITEWKQIKCPPVKKILYTFTFPLFIFTYVPISIAALFKKVEWKPIHHSVVKTLDEVR